MNETTFILTPELAPAVQSSSGGGLGALVPQSVTLITALLFIATIFVVLQKIIPLIQANNGGEIAKSGKGIFTAASTFFIIIILFSFFSYLGLTDFSKLLLPKLKKNESQAAVATQTAPLTTQSPPTTSGDIAFAQIAENESDVRALFYQSDIKINAAACKAVGQTSCTTVGGMSSQTIDMLINLKKACACDMTISGGTEWWAHSMTTKHRPGAKTAVDLRKDLYLTDFIKKGSQNGFQPATAWSTCYTAFSWNGFYFCDEKNTAPHWHIEPL